MTMFHVSETNCVSVLTGASVSPGQSPLLPPGLQGAAVEPQPAEGAEPHRRAAETGAPLDVTGAGESLIRFTGRQRLSVVFLARFNGTV